MLLPDVPTVASLDARGEIDLSEEGRARLLRGVGEPVGPQGIPKTAALFAGISYLNALWLPVLWPLFEIATAAFVQRVVAPRLQPWIHRRMARNKPPGWEEESRRFAEIHRRLVMESPFLRFHRRQALALGIVLLAVSVLTCGVGLVLGWIPYVVFGYRAWYGARRGEWTLVPWLGERLIRPFLAPGDEDAESESP